MTFNNLEYRTENSSTRLTSERRHEYDTILTEMKQTQPNVVSISELGTQTEISRLITGDDRTEPENRRRPIKFAITAYRN